MALGLLITNKGDDLLVAGINKPQLIDVANALDSMIYDVDHTLNKVLKPLYEELYASYENKEEMVAM